MTELLTAAQMRAIETAAIESGDVTGLELMERAGRGVVEAIFEEWPEYIKAPQSVSVLCGPGNNGGDGFVVARLLHSLKWDVNVWFWGEKEKLSPDARTNYNLWETLGPVNELREAVFRDAPGAAIYIDAIFGTGLTRAPEGELFDIVRHLSGVNGDRFNDRLVAIDAPSGLCLDSGRVLQQIPTNIWSEEILANMPPQLRARISMGGARPLYDRYAALTVCFDSPKSGHFLAQGPDLCGKLVVKDIGIAFARLRFNGDPYDEAFSYHRNPLVEAARPARLTLAEPPGRVQDDRFWLSLPVFLLRKHTGHKFSHGHALVLSGGSGRTGAARLAARGAMRVGAGLVTIGAPGNAVQEVACQITSLMLRRAGTAEELTAVLGDDRLNAICIGPGFGVDRARDMVPLVLGQEAPDQVRDGRRAVVLDADALTAYADDPDALFAMLHDKCILTPHGGEFARLFPDLSERLNAVPTQGPAYSKVDATREAAKRAGCVVLFKGPDTVIADPAGRCSVHAAAYDREAPWLATAGAGDVLAGFITGLMARGLTPMRAGETAAWLHVECARRFGPGLIAEDLPEQLPQVLRALENQKNA